MKGLDDILKDLHRMADPSYLSRLEYYGIKGAPQALGIKNTVLKPYAKELGRNQELAHQLWDQPVHDCKHLAIFISEPRNFPEETAEKWISACYSWDLVDGIGTQILPWTSFVLDKIEGWSLREPEYEKRMAFVAMVGVAIHNKKLDDDRIVAFLPTIERESWDERNFVKKAVNWALRTIGKRNLQLNSHALEAAHRIKSQDSKAARWIASDAIRELKSEKVQERLHKKKS